MPYDDGEQARVGTKLSGSVVWAKHKDASAFGNSTSLVRVRTFSQPSRSRSETRSSFRQACMEKLATRTLSPMGRTTL